MAQSEALEKEKLRNQELTDTLAQGKKETTELESNLRREVSSRDSWYVGRLSWVLQIFDLRATISRLETESGWKEDSNRRDIHVGG